MRQHDEVMNFDGYWNKQTHCKDVSHANDELSVDDRMVWRLKPQTQLGHI